MDQHPECRITTQSVKQHNHTVMSRKSEPFLHDVTEFSVQYEFETEIYVP